MKKNLLTTSFILLLNMYLFGQNVTFNYQGHSIGSSLSGQSYFPRAMMSEVVKIGSEYIMYFGYESPTECFIMYATSNDMLTWQVGDTVLLGSSDTTNREFIIGGPRVIKLSNGQYRMFYRASQEYTTSPYYHIRSAISNDGKNFTKEGICIEIKNYNSNSFFKHVGHSEFYYDAGNNLRALLTAKDTTMTDNEPDNIYLAQSSDGGLTWSDFVSKYPSCHDPVIIKDSSQTYQAYFTYLNTGFRTVTSQNGTSWPNLADTLFMVQNNDTITESSTPIKIADLGASVDASGNIVIYSNHSTQPGPWTHIAYWYATGITSISPYNAFASINIFPNPFFAQTTIQTAVPLINATLTVDNCFGHTIAQIKNINGHTITLNRNNLPSGLYFIQLTEDKKIIATKELIISD